MTTLHPHWQETDDADERRIPVRVTVSTEKRSEPRTEKAVNNVRPPVRATRRPAAFAGIALFLIMGAATFQVFGLGSIRGQVDTLAVNVHIRSTGADPVTITVQPGSTITWTNDDTIPHILSSETLPTVDGKPFVSSAIFPGSSTYILIPPTATPGAYPYISKTSDTVSGQIIIRAAGAAPAVTPTPTPSSDALVTPTPTVEQPTAPFVPAPTPDTTFQPEATPLPAQTTGIAINPHTIGSGEVPLPDRQTPGGVPAVTQHKPIATTESGPGVWVTVLFTIGTLLVVTRRAFRSI